MYVRRKKFVREKGSLRGSNLHTIRITSFTAIISMIIAMALALSITQGFYKMSFKVDPSIYEELQKGETIAYVSFEKNIEINCIEKWNFGKIHIYKIILKSQKDIDYLISKGAISIYGYKDFKKPPIHFLNINEYNFRQIDIDNEFHLVKEWIGRNITIGIIDTGIDYKHPDFYENGKIVIKAFASMLYKSISGNFIFFEPYKNGTIDDLFNYDDYIWRKYGEPAFLDINGHGTHTAGIIVGRGNAGNYKGIAWGAYLVVVKAFNKDGVAGMDTCLNSLEWIYNNTEKYDIKILSLSWGAAFASDGNDPLSLAVDEIANKNVLVFASAGNEGNIPTTINVPAVAKKAFAIGAWDAYKDKIAPFSSLGPTIDMRMKPDLMASGVMVVSCKSSFVSFPSEYTVGEYYVALSGTSMSAPTVAGIAADFIEYFKYWNGRNPSYNDFINYIDKNSRKINYVKDFISGWGIPIAPH
jgi:subtilisin family serine protease